MKLRAQSLVTLALVVAAGAASAADAKTYTVRFDDVWKVGDVVTRQAKETESTNVVVKQEGGAVLQEQKGSTTTTYRLVEQCLAAEGGKKTKSLLHLESWGIEGDGPKGPVKDDSLTGTHVELSGTGTTRTWKVVTPGKEVSEAAKAWLEKKFGGKAKEGADALLSPKEPVAPGATWSPDIAAVAKLMGSEEMDVDLAKSSIKVSFVEVQATKAGEFGKFTMEMTLQTKSIQSPQGPMTWKEGGAFTAKASRLRSLAEGSFDEERAMDLVLSGVSEPGPGILVTIEFKGSGQEAVGTGGEMPPVPAGK